EATRSRPKGFTDEDLANIDAYFRHGDPGNGLNPELRARVAEIAADVAAQVKKIDDLTKEIAGADRGILKARGITDGTPGTSQSTPPVATTSSSSTTTTTTTNANARIVAQHERKKAAFQQQLTQSQDILLQRQAEFAGLFSSEAGHDRLSVLRARNVHAQSATHLLNEPQQESTPADTAETTETAESRLAPDNAPDWTSNQAPGDRPQRGGSRGSGSHRGQDTGRGGSANGRGRGGSHRGGTPHPVTSSSGSSASTPARGGQPPRGGHGGTSGTNPARGGSTTSSRGSGTPSVRGGRAPRPAAPATVPAPAVTSIAYGNPLFTALIGGQGQGQGRGTLSASEYHARVLRSVSGAHPTSYVVNAVVDHETVAKSGRLQQFVDSVLEGLSPEMSGRVAIVVGVNGAVSEGDAAAAQSIRDAITTGTNGVDCPVPLAVVATPLAPWSSSFPYGTARNVTLTSTATREALHGLLARDTHPYVSFMDFDAYPHTTDSGRHVFDHFEARLGFGRAVTGSESQGLLPPLRPLLMSGGYRIPPAGDADGRTRLANETRDRWNNPKEVGQLGAAPTDVDARIEDFDREIRHDMRARNRMAALAPFMPYSPEPNLFVDGPATLVRGEAGEFDDIRFSPGAAEFNGLANSLMRLAAWEIRANDASAGPDVSLPAPAGPNTASPNTAAQQTTDAPRPTPPPASRLQIAAESLRPSVRGTAFVIDVNDAATQTDLSRLYFSMLKSRRQTALKEGFPSDAAVPRHTLRVQQSHLNPTPYTRLFHESAPATKNAKYGQLSALRDSGELLRTDSLNTVTALDAFEALTLQTTLSLPPAGSTGRDGDVEFGLPRDLRRLHTMNLLYTTDEGVLQRNFHEVAATYLADTAPQVLAARPESFFGALTTALTRAPGDTGTDVHPDVRRMLLHLQEQHQDTPAARDLITRAAEHGLTVEDLSTRLFTGRVHPMTHTLDHYIAPPRNPGTSSSTEGTFELDAAATFLLDLYAGALARPLDVTGPDGTTHRFAPPASTGAPVHVRWQSGAGWVAEAGVRTASTDDGAPGPSAKPGTKGEVSAGPKSGTTSGTKSAPSGQDRKGRRGGNTPTAAAPDTSTDPARPVTGTPSGRKRGEFVSRVVAAQELRAFHGAKTAAVHTERFDPKLRQLNPRPGHLDGSVTLIRNHVRRAQLADGRTVRHFFITLPFKLTDGLTATDLARHQQQVQQILDTHTNSGYRLPESGDQLRITAEFIHAPQHGEAVTLTQSANPGRADQLHWDVNHSDATLTHELLHYLGLADEYADTHEADPHLFRRNDQASGVRTEGLMANTLRQNLQHLPHDYLATIERVSNNAVIPLHTTTPAAQATPAAPATPTRPATTSGDSTYLPPDHTPHQPPNQAPAGKPVFLTQPHYASGDQFGIAAALLADENLSVILTHGSGNPAHSAAAEGMAAFYAASGIPDDRIHVVETAGRLKEITVQTEDGPLLVKLNKKNQLGVGDATKRVGKQFSTDLREDVRKAWKVGPDAER
ncbi:hypothetical protein ACIOG8_38095, partial [Streptomyces erythrochromogenes]